MCLELTKDSERLTQNLKEKKKSITVYKILGSDMISGFEYFRWKTGLNISNRELTKLTKGELRTNEINEGFHLALEKPEKCPNRRPYPCPNHYRCQCHYQDRYQYQCPYTKVFKCEIDPKDIIAVGIWVGIPSIVVTKVTLLEEVKYES